MNATEIKNEDRELEINILGMCTAVLKKIWIVILVAAVMGAGAFFYFRNTYVPVYQTRVGLYMIGNEQAPATGTAVQIATNIAKDYELLIKDPVVLDKVSAAIKEKGIEADAASLARCISVESPENTRILWINVNWDSSESVKIIANAVRDAAQAELKDVTNVTANSISDAKAGTLRSDNIKRNTVIFAFLGACFTAFIIALIFVFDDKLTSRRDIEERLGLSVLGIIPNAVKDKKQTYKYKYYKKY